MDAIFPHLSFVSCLVIAACLTPTDPVICASIVGTFFLSTLTSTSTLHALPGGKYAVEHVPEELRHILAAESAANDGLAYPFLSISIYLTVELSRGVAFEKWIVVGWLCESLSINVQALLTYV